MKNEIDIYTLIQYFYEILDEIATARAIATGKKKDSGVHGNALELACKVFFNLATTDTATVSPNGKKDIRKTIDGKPSYMEIKTGSGSYGKVLDDGTLVNEFKGNMYIIYQATMTTPIYVVPMTAFDQQVRLNFTRKDKYATTDNTKTKNVRSIKTLNDHTSHRERDRINAMCKQYGTEITDFIKLHKIANM